MKIKARRTHPSAPAPVYATDGSGCFDLKVMPTDIPYESIYIHAGETKVMRTGLAFEIPETHVMLIFSRSGHGFKHDTRLANCVGVIDSDYRGEVMVKLSKDSRATNSLVISKGDSIAQAMVLPVEKVEFDFVDELSETERGEGGFGSTNKP